MTRHLVSFWYHLMLRDRRVLISLLLFGATPHVFAFTLGREWAAVACMLALLLPLPIGWLWGEELHSGSVVLLALAGQSPRRLLLACEAAMLSVVLGISLTFLPYLRPGLALVALSVMVTMLAIGFLCVSLVQSSDAGWLVPLFAVVGVWAPLITTFGSSGLGRHLPAWLRVLIMIMLPYVALGLQLASAKVVTSVLLGTAFLCSGLAVLTLSPRRSRNGL